VLPPIVRQFIEQRIDDAAQLEILLLLERHPDRSWSAAEAADAVRLSVRDAAKYLEALGRRDLLDVRLSSDVRYRFNPASADLEGAVRHVAESYRDRRNETLAFVALRGRHSLRAFADAFRFTRRDDDA
jgi:hypothetical protein